MGLIYNGHTFTDGLRCTCCVKDAVVRTDPTGTLALRRALATALRVRWRMVRGLVRTTLGDRDMLGLRAAQPSAAVLAGATQVQVFQRWMDSTLQNVVLQQDGSVFRPYLARARAGGVQAGQAHVGNAVMPVDTGKLDVFVQLAIVELEGVVEAVSQQAVRAVANGLLLRQSAAGIARAVQSVIDKIGVERSDMIAELMIVKVHNDTTLDVLETAGVTEVDLIPEARVVKTRVSSQIGDAARKTGPGSRSSRRKTPSARTISRIAKLERETEAWAKHVNVVTAEDDKVCPICEGIAEDGPYTINRARGLIPAHVRCRCAFVPARKPRALADFNEVEHPREPKGTSVGGQFAWRSSDVEWDKVMSDFNQLHVPAGSPTGGQFASRTEFGLRRSNVDLRQAPVDNDTADKLRHDSLSDPLTGDEIEAISFYTGKGYREMNYALRSGDLSNPKIRQYQQDLDSAFEKVALAKEMTTYRGLSDKRIAELHAAPDGTVFTDRAFVSTSASRKVADGFVQGQSVRLVLQKGTRAIPLGNMSTNKSESEYLVNRNSRYIKRTDSVGKTYLELEKD